MCELNPAMESAKVSAATDRSMQATTPRTRRSRISPEREAELYAAVLDLLREVGYEALTRNAVATRTSCRKAARYRQWAGKLELIAQALRHTKGNAIGDIDTGSLHGDFHELVAHRDLLRALQDLILDLTSPASRRSWWAPWWPGPW